MKYILKFSFFIFIFCGYDPIVLAKGIKTKPFILNLQQAQEIAIKQHPEIISNQYLTKLTQETITQVESSYLPQISGDAIRTFSKSTSRLTATGEINSPSVYQRGAMGISVNQMVTDFGRTNSLVTAASADVSAQMARSLSVRERILFKVTQNYYNVLRAEKILQVAQQTLTSRQTLQALINSLFEQQLKSDLDVSYAEQTVQEAKLLVINAENSLDDARTELSESMGYEEQKIFILENSSSVAIHSKDLESYLKMALIQNPELKMLKAELSSADSTHQAEQAAHYPTISVMGYAGETPYRKDEKINPSYVAAGINISVPVYTGGKLTANERKAFYRMKSVKQDLKNKNNQVIRDVRIAWNNVQNAYKNIGVTEEMVKTSMKALELMEANYQLQKVSVVDLTQAELNQTQAKIAHANAIFNYLINLALLKFRAGDSFK